MESCITDPPEDELIIYTFALCVIDWGPGCAVIFFLSNWEADFLLIGRKLSLEIVVLLPYFQDFYNFYYLACFFIVC